MNENLLEVLDKTYFKEQKKEPFSKIENKNIIINDLEYPTPSFFDNGLNDLNSYNTNNSIKDNINKQNYLIETYRRISLLPEVNFAVDEITDEAVFIETSSGNFFNIIFNESKTKKEFEKTITESFNKILNLLNLERNLYTLFKRFYIDGQLISFCEYNKKNLKSGIDSIKILNPINFIFDEKENVYYYIDSNQHLINKESIYSKDEIIKIDSGIHDKGLILSNLHTAIKPANMLSTLEDMLIPLRFSRSTSRRVFNVDVSRLNSKQALEVMEKNQRNFKYKKFYNAEDGTISNQQHITSLVEDYWFPNRGGEKGTTVETLDESGNIGEIGDINYIKQKLYTSLKIPSNRIIGNEKGEAIFDYETTSTSREEIKFFNFIQRLRNQFLVLIYELLKRELLVTGKIKSISEWNKLKDFIRIKFSSENKFFEKMEQEFNNKKIEAYNQLYDLGGKFLSFEYIFKNALKMTDEEITKMKEQIQSEKKDPFFKNLYNELEAESEEF